MLKFMMLPSGSTDSATWVDRLPESKMAYLSSKKGRSCQVAVAAPIPLLRAAKIRIRAAGVYLDWVCTFCCAIYSQSTYLYLSGTLSVYFFHYSNRINLY